MSTGTGLGEGVGVRVEVGVGVEVGVAVGVKVAVGVNVDVKVGVGVGFTTSDISHIRMEPSLLPLSIRRPSEEKATALTAPVWPLNVRLIKPVSKSKI